MWNKGKGKDTHKKTKELTENDGLAGKKNESEKEFTRLEEVNSLEVRPSRDITPQSTLSISSKNQERSRSSSRMHFDFFKKENSIKGAQAWLEEKCNKKNKSERDKLHLIDHELEGDLVIENFEKLEEISLQPKNKKVGGLTSLFIKDCPNLKILNCSNNQLIDFNLSNCPNLTKVNCGNNNLTELNFISEINSEKLTSLDISDNNFPEQGLHFLSHLINLEELQVGNFDHYSEVDESSYNTKLKNKIYNRFFGSLKPLEKMNSLRVLSISNTNIDGGLVYLSKSLKMIVCDANEINGEDDFRCKIIGDNLVKYGEKSKGEYDHRNFLIDELLKEKEDLRERLRELQEENHKQVEILQEKNIYPRNILLLGMTGGGKSTLANVISNTNKFRESGSSISETKQMQSEEFEADGIKYCINDTIGFGDTHLSAKEVTKRISNATYSVKDGLNQILFVIGGRFMDKEIEAYDLLKEIFFDKDIAKYITVVRTRFPDFRDEKKCQEDIEKISKENKRLAELIESCNEVIHMDNPELAGAAKEINKVTRDLSRDKLLNHLKNCQGVYSPQNLREYTSLISNNMITLDELKKRKEEAFKNNDDKLARELSNKISKNEEEINKKTHNFVQENERWELWEKNAAEVGKLIGMFLGNVAKSAVLVACQIS